MRQQKTRAQQRSTWPARLFSVALIACAGDAMAMAPDNQAVTALVSGNTLHVINKYGPSQVYFDPSGTLLEQVDGRLSAVATWRATEDSVCSTYNPKPDGRIMPEFCLKLLGRQVGDSWTGDDPRNGKLLFHLRAGKQPALH